jgi:hypothetical protein
MSVLKRTAVAAAVLCLTVAPALAGQKGGKHGPPVKTPPTAKQQPVQPATHGNPHTTEVPKATGGGSSHAPKTTAAAAEHPASGKTAKAPKTTSATTTTTTTGTTATTRTTEPTSPVAQKIAQHPKLESKLTAMLPAGMTLDRAAAGFRNQGQFVAALHVSKNLGIPFVDLKTAMTGPDAKSLGQAIQTLKPFANATTETARAEREANADLK